MDKPMGGGVLSFFTVLPPPPPPPKKKYQEFQTPPINIWNFSSPKNILHSVYWPSGKTLKCIEMTSKYSLILWWPPKNIHKIFILQKYLVFWNPQKYWNSKFWTPKYIPGQRMYETIRLPLPSPLPRLGTNNKLFFSDLKFQTGTSHKILQANCYNQIKGNLDKLDICFPIIIGFPIMIDCLTQTVNWFSSNTMFQWLLTPKLSCLSQHTGE